MKLKTLQVLSYGIVLSEIVVMVIGIGVLSLMRRSQTKPFVPPILLQHGTDIALKSCINFGATCFLLIGIRKLSSEILKTWLILQIVFLGFLSAGQLFLLYENNGNYEQSFGTLGLLLIYRPSALSVIYLLYVKTRKEEVGPGPSINATVLAVFIIELIILVWTIYVAIVVYFLSSPPEYTGAVLLSVQFGYLWMLKVGIFERSNAYLTCWITLSSLLSMLQVMALFLMTFMTYRPLHEGLIWITMAFVYKLWSTYSICIYRSRVRQDQPSGV